MGLTSSSLPPAEPVESASTSTYSTEDLLPLRIKHVSELKLMLRHAGRANARQQNVIFSFLLEDKVDHTTYKYNPSTGWVCMIGHQHAGRPALSTSALLQGRNSTDYVIKIQCAPAELPLTFQWFLWCNEQRKPFVPRVLSHTVAMREEKGVIGIIAPGDQRLPESAADYLAWKMAFQRISSDTTLPTQNMVHAHALSNLLVETALLMASVRDGLGSTVGVKLALQFSPTDYIEGNEGTEVCYYFVPAGPMRMVITYEDGFEHDFELSRFPGISGVPFIDSTMPFPRLTVKLMESCTDMWVLAQWGHLIKSSTLDGHSPQHFEEMTSALRWLNKFIAHENTLERKGMGSMVDKMNAMLLTEGVPTQSSKKRRTARRHRRKVVLNAAETVY